MPIMQDDAGLSHGGGVPQCPDCGTEGISDGERRSRQFRERSICIVRYRERLWPLVSTNETITVVLGGRGVHSSDPAAALVASPHICLRMCAENVPITLVGGDSKPV